MQSDSKNAKLLFNFAMLLFCVFEDYERASRFFKKAHKLNPGNLRAKKLYKTGNSICEICALKVLTLFFSEQQVEAADAKH